MASDRFLSAAAAFVRELFPRLGFMGLFQYSVISFDDGAQTADLSPVSREIGMPDLQGVPIRLPGLVFTKLGLPAGTVVLVGFENYDPSKPFVAHCMLASAIAG